MQALSTYILHYLDIAMCLSLFLRISVTTTSSFTCPIRWCSSHGRSWKPHGQLGILGVLEER